MPQSTVSPSPPAATPYVVLLPTGEFTLGISVTIQAPGTVVVSVHRYCTVTPYVWIAWRVPPGLQDLTRRSVEARLHTSVLYPVMIVVASGR